MTILNAVECGPCTYRGMLCGVVGFGITASLFTSDGCRVVKLSDAWKRDITSWFI